MSQQTIDPDQIHATKYWHKTDDGRVQCDLCPRYCRLKSGQRGLCYIRANYNDRIVLTSYGRSSGFCIDPIEKKPLNHFFPGSAVLSFGTAGCNLSCKFCQNWDISKSRDMDRLADYASPEAIARAALKQNCQSIAFTYNDPVIFHEYAIDVAQACHEKGIHSVAVSAGYVCEQPRFEFYQHMDAANIDLKSFNQRFYHQLTGSHLQPVLDTLIYLKHQTRVWLEITTLLIPGENDSEQEITLMCEWIMQQLGPDVPLHFTAFHPDYKLLNRPATPLSTLQKARAIAMSSGLHHVYTGNVHDKKGQSTYCSQCNELLIERDRYQILQWNLQQNRCPVCSTVCSGLFEKKPGDWGSRRVPVAIQSY